MGATVDDFTTIHRVAEDLLEQINSTSGQQRVDKLNSLKEALLAHVGEENSVIQKAMEKPDADSSFKSSAQNFLDELGNIAQAALIPFFDKYSSCDSVDSKEFMGDFGGIKGAVLDRISFEEEHFYPELERHGY
ncbi:cheY-like receiver [Candidatus Scalindua japonica]|uniref:CheY-like receiver n=1 Tax=Candidatus Scalindua japonica TaxID=1284222 RepID=A0A286TU93_9BACT|nr:hemerythrin domain-containing protein [Candidatus Scalindua japonica]GAX59421.1 cheY-like receiver [Candidatus Scalindua japonica]